MNENETLCDEFPSENGKIEFYDNFAETYKDRLDDIRKRVGKDQEAAVEAFAEELYRDDTVAEPMKENLIDLIWRSL